MTETKTALGLVKVGSQLDLFAEAAALAVARHDVHSRRPPLWALSGGSTPQAWYRWCVAHHAIPSRLAAMVRFTVSDERWLPESSPQSNLGNAARLLLDPLAVPAAHRISWPVALEPGAAAQVYSGAVALATEEGRAYDVCLLGLGDDAHTASLFPGSPLLVGVPGGPFFTTVDVPGKGRRGTITPAGLRACGLIVVMVTGAAKAAAVGRVFRGRESPDRVPARILESCADRTVWLLDEAAAAGLAG